MVFDNLIMVMMMMMLVKLRSDEVFAKRCVQNLEQNQTVAFAAKTRRKCFLNKNFQRPYAHPSANFFGGSTRYYTTFCELVRYITQY